MSHYIVIGKLVGVHGVKGAVKVAPLTDDVRRFSALKHAFLLDAKEKLVRDVQVVSSRTADTLVICELDFLNDRDQAKAYSGHYLAVARENAVTLEPGRYFIADLMGLEINDRARGVVGHILDIVPGTGADVIVVKRPGKKDLLFPYLNAIVSHVDLDNKRMEVALPDDLYDIYEDKVTQENE